MVLISHKDKQIYRCKDCKFACHENCLSQVPATCKKAVPEWKKETTFTGLHLRSRIKHSIRKRLSSADLVPLPLRNEKKERTIPPVLEQCLLFLQKEKALQTEGIFRLSAPSKDIQSLKGKFDKAKKPREQAQILKGLPIEKKNVHLVAGLLRLFIREMEHPLLSFELYDVFMGIMAASLPDETRIEAIRHAIKQLPNLSQVILHNLMSLLNKTSSFESINKMKAGSIAIVFAPSLLRPEVETIEIILRDSDYCNKLVELMIALPQEIFNKQPKPSLPADLPPTVFELFERATKILDEKRKLEEQELKKKQNLAEKARVESMALLGDFEQCAAIMIQSLWRGYRQRKLLRTRLPNYNILRFQGHYNRGLWNLLKLQKDLTNNLGEIFALYLSYMWFLSDGSFPVTSNFSGAKRQAVLNHIPLANQHTISKYQIATIGSNLDAIINCHKEFTEYLVTLCESWPFINPLELGYTLINKVLPSFEPYVEYVENFTKSQLTLCEAMRTNLMLNRWVKRMPQKSKFNGYSLKKLLTLPLKQIRSLTTAIKKITGILIQYISVQAEQASFEEETINLLKAVGMFAQLTHFAESAYYHFQFHYALHRHSLIINNPNSETTPRINRNPSDPDFTGPSGSPRVVARLTKRLPSFSNLTSPTSSVYTTFTFSCNVKKFKQVQAIFFLRPGNLYVLLPDNQNAVNSGVTKSFFLMAIPEQLQVARGSVTYPPSFSLDKAEQQKQEENTTYHIFIKTKTLNEKDIFKETKVFLNEQVFGVPFHWMVNREGGIPKFITDLIRELTNFARKATKRITEQLLCFPELGAIEQLKTELLIAIRDKQQFNWGKFKPSVLTGFLRQFLEELPAPLLPTAICQRYIAYLYSTQRFSQSPREPAQSPGEFLCALIREELPPKNRELLHKIATMLYVFIHTEPPKSMSTTVSPAAATTNLRKLKNQPTPGGGKTPTKFFATRGKIVEDSSNLFHQHRKNVDEDEGCTRANRSQTLTLGATREMSETNTTKRQWKIVAAMVPCLIWFFPTQFPPVLPKDFVIRQSNPSSCDGPKEREYNNSTPSSSPPNSPSTKNTPSSEAESSKPSDFLFSVKRYDQCCLLILDLLSNINLISH